MIDNREIFPVGTVMTVLDGVRQFLVYGQNGRQERMPASLAIKRKAERFVGVPDIMNGCDNLSINKNNYSPYMMWLQRSNHRRNVLHAVHKTFPQSDTVVVIAPGRIDAMPEGFPIVGIGRGGEKADYIVAIDPQLCSVKSFDGLDTSNKVGVFSTYCSPMVAGLGWKDKTWFTSLPQRLDGIPYSHQTEGVITDAVWFAVHGLGAKKVILLGVEQPPIDRNYYWQGIFLQVHCYWYSKHGIEIWNCTPATSVVAGVKLGTLEEACQ